MIHSLLQSVHSTGKVYRVQASIPAKRESTRSTYLPTYLPIYLPPYLPRVGTYHTQNGNRYVGKTSNQVMFLLQLVQKYFPTSSFFPDCPSARTTCVWCCPNTPFRACEGHLGTKPKEPRKCCLGSQVSVQDPKLCTKRAERCVSGATSIFSISLEKDRRAKR